MTWAASGFGGAVVGDGDVDVDDESLESTAGSATACDDGGEFGVELGDGPRLG